MGTTSAASQGNQGDFIEIPTYGLHRAGGKQRVKLPIYGNPRPLASICIGALFFLLGCMFLTITVASFANGHTNHNGFWLAFLLLLGVLGLLGFLVAVVTFRDLWQNRPILDLSLDNITDRRISNTPIAWSNVERVVALSHNGGVLLYLRQPISGASTGCDLERWAMFIDCQRVRFTSRLAPFGVLEFSGMW